MWAMIPMLRTRSRPTLRVLVSKLVTRSPAVVREGLVGLRHSVEVVLALERAALLVERVEDLAGELLVHVLLAALAREGDDPAHGERAGAPLRNLDGNLVLRTADAARANLEHRRHRLHGLLQHVDRRLAGLRADAVERAVDDLLRGGALPAGHHLVDHLGDEVRVVDGVRRDGADLDFGAPRHYVFLAPYFDRPCFRSPTPAVSR